MSGIGKSIEAERQKSSLTAQREEEEEIGYGCGVSFIDSFWPAGFLVLCAGIL